MTKFGRRRQRPLGFVIRHSEFVILRVRHSVFVIRHLPVGRGSHIFSAEVLILRGRFAAGHGKRRGAAGGRGRNSQVVLHGLVRCVDAVCAWRWGSEDARHGGSSTSTSLDVMGFMLVCEMSQALRQRSAHTLGAPRRLAAEGCFSGFS
jgi:hypothetical protein